VKEHAAGLAGAFFLYGCSLTSEQVDDLVPGSHHTRASRSTAEAGSCPS